MEILEIAIGGGVKVFQAYQGFKFYLPTLALTRSGSMGWTIALSATKAAPQVRVDFSTKKKALSILRSQ